MKLSLALAVLLLVPQLSFAWGFRLAGKNHECGSSNVEGGQRFSYCIDRPEANASSEVVYYFHGVLHNEQTWFTDYDREFRAEWENMGVAQPTVISISFPGSFGNFWLLSEPSGRYRYLRGKVMPFIEGKVGFPITRRLLVGTSMGGFNSSQLLFRDGSVFSRVALLSPAFITVGPYAPQSEIDEYFRRHDSKFVGRFKINTYLSYLKAEYKSAELWAASNPLELVKVRNLPKGIRLYISGADADNYGFQEGAEQFANAAREKGARLKWNLLDGGHKAVDKAEVAQFLLEP